MTDSPSTAWRFTFGTALAFTMCMAPFVQYGIAALAPFIIEDLGMSRTRVGSLISVSFAMSALAGPMVGRLVDIVGGRRIAVALFLLGIGSLVALGSAGGYPLLVVGALLAGIAMGAANPATNDLIGQAILPGSRGLLMGIKQSGVKIGQLLASSTLPTMAVAWGWRMAFLVSGGAAALIGVAATRVLPRHADTRPVRERRRDGSRLPALIPTLVLYGFLMGIPQAAVATYMPLYAFERLDFSPALAGIVAGFIGLVGMVSRIVWGRAAERLNSIARPLVIIALGATLSVLLLVVAQLGPTHLVWVGALIFGATAPVWNVVGMLAVIRTAGAGSTGRASGMVMAGFSTGFIVGPMLFGLSVDLTDDYLVGWISAGVCALCAAVVAGSSRHVRETTPV